MKFPLAPMGVLDPGSARAQPSAQSPIDTTGNFSAHVHGMVGKTSIFSPFQVILSTFRFFQKKTKKLTHRGVGGPPKFLFTQNLIFFVT